MRIFAFLGIRRDFFEGLEEAIRFFLVLEPKLGVVFLGFNVLNLVLHMCDVFLLVFGFGDS